MSEGDRQIVQAAPNSKYPDSIQVIFLDHSINKTGTIDSKLVALAIDKQMLTASLSLQ